jgi:hypothetical protein
LQNADWSEEELEEELLEVSASFWTQQLQGDPFSSPLWYFVGVLGIDGGSGQHSSINVRVLHVNQI